MSDRPTTDDRKALSDEGAATWASLTSAAGIGMAVVSFAAVLYVVFGPSELSETKRVYLAFVAATIPAALFAAQAAKLDLSTKGLAFSVGGGTAIMLGAFVVLDSRLPPPTRSPEHLTPPVEQPEPEAPGPSGSAEVRLIAVASGNRLRVTDSDSVDLGVVPPPYQDLVDAMIEPELAAEIGMHLAEFEPGSTVNRRAPQRACQYLAVAHRRSSADGDEQWMRASSRALFHLKDACLAEGVGDVVIEAMAHRPMPQGHKELGDVLYSYGQERADHRAGLYALASASYLRFMASGCGSKCDEVTKNVRGAQRWVAEAVGEDLARDIERALGDGATAQRRREVAADVQQVVAVPAEL